MFNDPLAQLARRWVYRIRRPDAGRKSHLVRLAVNGLEDRLAPAQLPAATVFESRTFSTDVPDRSVATFAKPRQEPTRLVSPSNLST